ncbi:hypothetical protein Anapl_03993 [Anas platyrhynchos]|uniref:Uncharacterized protein n=1 Tax=Anas platyrhynchos TaxID=8839 RepID=R0LLQ2_ANAPL|nr:hypothetical protein Anapl_03993 [Anas platyrhynchos]
MWEAVFNLLPLSHQVTLAFYFVSAVCPLEAILCSEAAQESLRRKGLGASRSFKGWLYVCIGFLSGELLMIARNRFCRKEMYGGYTRFSGVFASISLCSLVCGTSEKADGEVKAVVGGGFANWLIEMPGTAVDLGFEWSPVLSIKKMRFEGILHVTVEKAGPRCQGIAAVMLQAQPARSQLSSIPNIKSDPPEVVAAVVVVMMMMMDFARPWIGAAPPYSCHHPSTSTFPQSQLVTWDWCHLSQRCQTIPLQASTCWDWELRKLRPLGSLSAGAARERRIARDWWLPKCAQQALAHSKQELLQTTEPFSWHRGASLHPGLCTRPERGLALLLGECTYFCTSEFCCETQTQTSQAGLVELRVSRNNRLGFGGGFGRARSSARWESEGGNLKREAMQPVDVEGLLSSLLSAESWASDKPLITVLTARFSARAAKEGWIGRDSSTHCTAINILADGLQEAGGRWLCWQQGKGHICLPVSSCQSWRGALDSSKGWQQMGIAESPCTGDAHASSTIARYRFGNQPKELGHGEEGEINAIIEEEYSFTESAVPVPPTSWYAALIRHSCARSSCEKGPQAGCKLYDMMEQTGAKTQAFCHDQTQPLQGLGRDDRLHRKGNARQQSLQPLGNMQSSRDGLKHGNNRGVALLTLITQMFKVPARISADAELRQQHELSQENINLSINWSCWPGGCHKGWKSGCSVPWEPGEFPERSGDAGEEERKAAGSSAEALWSRVLLLLLDPQRRFCWAHRGGFVQTLI